MRSLMFCDFVDPKNAARPYTEVQNMEKLQLVMENYLEEYNNISKKPMNLVLFRYMNNQRTTVPLKNRPRCYAKSPTAQDVFRPIPSLISCAGVTGGWGLHDVIALSPW